MKSRIYTLILALCAAWNLQSCDNDDNDSIAVPAELQNAFSSRYPNAANVKWESKAGYYVADFYDGYESSAWFTQNGKWQMTETDIPYNALPQAVKTSFETGEYASWRVDDVDKLERADVETMYVIEVEDRNREIDLYYSEEGVLVKNVVDTDGDKDGEYLPEQNVRLTEAMRNFIDTRYPGAKLMEIDIEDDGPNRGFTEVDIVHFDNDLGRNVSKEILFDRNGEWYSTSWDVRKGELPAGVSETIDTQINMIYIGYRLDDAERIENADSKYYRIELEANDREAVLMIADNGELITGPNRN